MRCHNINIFVIRQGQLLTSWAHPPATVGDRRRVRRLHVFVLVLLCGATMVATGVALKIVLFSLLCVGLAGATIAQWVVDGAARRSSASMFAPAESRSGVA